MTSNASVSIVVGKVLRTFTLFRVSIKYEVSWAAQTLFLVLVVVGVLGAGQTPSVLEEGSISGAALAHLSLGVVNLSISASSTSSVDDERSILRALTFVISCIVNESLRA